MFNKFIKEQCFSQPGVAGVRDVAYDIISHVVFEAEYGIRLYRFLIIAFSSASLKEVNRNRVGCFRQTLDAVFPTDLFSDYLENTYFRQEYAFVLFLLLVMPTFSFSR